MKEEIQIKNSKGQSLSAVIHGPDTKTEKIAILCPGFLDSKDYDHLVLLAEELVKKGFIVVRFDPTGTWKSEGDISDYTITQYLEDIKSVKDYMLNEREYSFILLGGHSMGGRMSLFYASTDSDISLVLDIMGGYQKAPNPAKEDKWKTDGVKTNIRDFPDNPKEKKEYHLPYSFIPDSAQYNVLDTIEGLHAPILLIAGEKDVLCTPSILQTIYDKANEPKKFIIIPDIGHDYRFHLDQIKIVNNEIIKFLDTI